MKPFVWLGILGDSWQLASSVRASPTPAEKKSSMSDRFMQPQRGTNEFPFRPYSAAWLWREGIALLVSAGKRSSSGNA